jgi:hypothetical protein
VSEEKKIALLKNCLKGDESKWLRKNKLKQQKKILRKLKRNGEV